MSASGKRRGEWGWKIKYPDGSFEFAPANSPYPGFPFPFKKEAEEVVKMHRELGGRKEMHGVDIVPADECDMPTCP